MSHRNAGEIYNDNVGELNKLMRSFSFGLNSRVRSAALTEYICLAVYCYISLVNLHANSGCHLLLIVNRCRRRGLVATSEDAGNQDLLKINSIGKDFHKDRTDGMG